MALINGHTTAGTNDSDESGGPPSIPTSGISSNGGAASANSTPPPPPPPPPPAPGAPGAPGGSGAQVLLKDVAPLVRLNLVSPPAGFSKLGHPLIYFPDDLQDDFNF